MESTAFELGSRSIGVVLSGTGSEGAEGSRIIKAEGGISFAQTPDSAAYDSMPVKAIAIDDIDFILDPKAIALEIMKISKLPLARAGERAFEISREEKEDFNKIMVLLKQSTSIKLPAKYRAKFNADFAISNSGGVRATIPAGKITLESIMTVLPFGNDVGTAEMTGAGRIYHVSAVYFLHSRLVCRRL